MDKTEERELWWFQVHALLDGILQIQLVHFSSSFTIWISHVLILCMLLLLHCCCRGGVDGFCFSVYTMNGEAYLGGAMSGEAFWDGVHGRSKSQFQGARCNILSISICFTLTFWHLIENPNVDFSSLLAFFCSCFFICVFFCKIENLVSSPLECDMFEHLSSSAHLLCQCFISKVFISTNLLNCKIE